METTQPRILAYQLATLVPDSHLQDISGGGAPGMTYRSTFKISGPTAAVDTSFDVTVDG